MIDYEDMPALEKHHKPHKDKIYNRVFFNRSCNRKKRFRTAKEAHWFLQKRSLDLRVYECQFCKGFHTSSLE